MCGIEAGPADDGLLTVRAEVDHVLTAVNAERAKTASKVTSVTIGNKSMHFTCLKSLQAPKLICRTNSVSEPTVVSTKQRTITLHYNAEEDLL